MSNSIVIIEDEARTRAFLKTFIEEHYQWLDVIGEARGVTTGLKLIREKSPDIVLLDIEMQDGTGFDLLDKLNDDQQLVIFVTAYSEYAIHAIKKKTPLITLRSPLILKNLAKHFIAPNRVWKEELPVAQATQLKKKRLHA